MQLTSILCSNMIPFAEFQWFMVSFVFCDSMWSFWVEANIRVCLFVYYRWRSSYPDLAGSDSIKWFNKDLHLQRHMSYVMVFFVFSELRWEVIVSFVDTDGFFYHQCLTFLSIITRIVSCNPLSNIPSVIKWSHIPSTLVMLSIRYVQLVCNMFLCTLFILILYVPTKLYLCITSNGLCLYIDNVIPSELKNNTSGAGTDYPSGAPEFTPGS